MDIEALLDDAAVLLDLTETSLERIIHTILTKTLDILDAPLAYEEAMTTLFLPESGNILAKTIQVFFILESHYLVTQRGDTRHTILEKKKKLYNWEM